MRLRNLQKNTKAISEEFTVLPSLAVVLFGILLSFVLIGTTYGSHHEQSQLIDTMTTTELIYTRIINPSTPFVKTNGIIDYSSLFTTESMEYIKSYQVSLLQSGLNFSFHISSKNLSFWYPKQPPMNVQKTAVTHSIGLSFNPVKTEDAILSIVVWNDKENLT